MELTTALKALADDNRLLILRLLGRRDYCVRAPGPSAGHLTGRGFSAPKGIEAGRSGLQ